MKTRLDEFPAADLDEELLFLVQNPLTLAWGNAPLSGIKDYLQRVITREDVHIWSGPWDDYSAGVAGCALAASLGRDLYDRVLNLETHSGGMYYAGFALKLNNATFGINTGNDSGTEVQFDPEHPGITPEDTVTWGSSIGDYGVNLIIDTGTLDPRGLTLATAHAALASRVSALENAPAYSLPLAQNGVRGGIQIGYTQSGKNYPVRLSSEKAYVNVPWTDTTYDPGTTSMLNTGTDTDNRVWSAKALADWLSGKSYLTSAVTSLGGTSGAITLGTGLEIVSGELRVTGQTSGTVTQVNVGSTPYTPTDGVVTLPAYPTVPSNVSAFTNDAGYITSYVNTWRNVYTGGTSRVGTGTDTKGINFVAGSNVTITYEAAGTGSGRSGSANYFNVKIAASHTNYNAGFALTKATDTFAVNVGDDPGTAVTFDTDHPGITPEDTVTWGSAIGDYGINLTIDTGTAVTKGLALASALNSLRTTVNGLVTGVSSVAGKTGAVSLVIGDIANLQTALDGKQPTGNYLTSAVTSLGTKTGAITLGFGLSINDSNVLTATGTTYTPGTGTDLNTGTSLTTMVWSPSVLATWLSGKNYITNSVSNLTNYYKKTETYTQAEVNSLIGGISGFSYVIAASTSAVTNPQSNVLYLIGPTGTGTDKYEEYVYPNSTAGWTKIGDTSIDLSGYVNTLATSGSGNYVASLSKSGNTITATYGTLPTAPSVVTSSANGLAPMFSSGNKTSSSSSNTYYFLGITGSTLKWYSLPANAFNDHQYSAGLGLKLASGVFKLNTDTGTDVTFDTDHPGITPEDTVTWGSAIGDYGVNLTIDTGTAVTKGLALASAVAALQTAVAGKQDAGNYLTSVPAATSSVVGGFLLGYEQSGRNYPVQLSSNKAYVYVPWVSYSNATTDTAGLMSPADKAKLDGVASSATAVNDATVSGWGYVKSSGITSVTQGQATSGGAVTTSGSSVTIQFPTLPTASKTVLGGIILGSGLTYNSTTGKVDVTGQTQGTVTSITVNGGSKDPVNGVITLDNYWKSGDTRTANYVLAGPTSGSAAAATFRALVAADIPSITKSKISDFPTAVSAFTNDANYATLAGSEALTNKTYNGLTLTKATTGFTIAGGTTSKTLTVSETYTLGAACAKAVDSSISAASTSTNLPTSAAVASFVEGKNYLTGNQTITLSGDVSGRGATSISVSIGTGKVTNAMLAGSIENSKLNTIGVTKGGTGKTSIAAFAIIYASAANTYAELAPNTTSTRKFLRMTGTGSAGAAPAWDTVTKGDVGLGNVPNFTWTYESDVTYTT